MTDIYYILYNISLLFNRSHKSWSYSVTACQFRWKCKNINKMITLKKTCIITISDSLLKGKLIDYYLNSSISGWVNITWCVNNTMAVTTCKSYPLPYHTTKFTNIQLINVENIDPCAWPDEFCTGVMASVTHTALCLSPMCVYKPSLSDKVCNVLMLMCVLMLAWLHAADHGDKRLDNGWI